MKVADLMTAKVVTIHPRDTLAEADEKMHRGGFRHLPVIDDGGALLGIVTERNLREHKGYLSTSRVTAAMVESPVTVGPEESIERAAETILALKIGCLPVLNKGALIGIITETDLLAGLLRQLKSTATRTA